MATRRSTRNTRRSVDSWVATTTTTTAPTPSQEQPRESTTTSSDLSMAAEEEHRAAAANIDSTDDNGATMEVEALVHAYAAVSDAHEEEVVEEDAMIVTEAEAEAEVIIDPSELQQQHNDNHQQKVAVPLNSNKKRKRESSKSANLKNNDEDDAIIAEQEEESSSPRALQSLPSKRSKEEETRPTLRNEHGQVPTVVAAAATTSLQNSMEQLQELTHETPDDDDNNDNEDETSSMLRECTSQKGHIHEGTMTTTFTSFPRRSLVARAPPPPAAVASTSTTTRGVSVNSNSKTTSSSRGMPPTMEQHRNNNEREEGHMIRNGHSQRSNLEDDDTVVAANLLSLSQQNETRTSNEEEEALLSLNHTVTTATSQGVVIDSTSTLISLQVPTMQELDHNHYNESTFVDADAPTREEEGAPSQPSTTFSFSSNLSSFAKKLVEEGSLAVQTFMTSKILVPPVAIALPSDYDFILWIRLFVGSVLQRQDNDNSDNNNDTVQEPAGGVQVLPDESTSTGNVSSDRRYNYLKQLFNLLLILVFKLVSYGVPLVPSFSTTKVQPTATYNDVTSSVEELSMKTDSIGNLTTIDRHNATTTDRESSAAPTLRQYLTHPDGFHLAMGPAFFGFYAYFGTLIALEEEIGILQPHWNDVTSWEDEPRRLLQSVSGASAGAMAAILLASGISPRRAADFACTLGIRSFADPFGAFAMFRGWKFEGIMNTFIKEHSPLLSSSAAVDVPFLSMEDGIVPVAVTAFDLMTMNEVLLDKGSMSSAARASATFPGLFQPVMSWLHANDTVPSLLMDGGTFDVHGLNGLSAFPPPTKNARVVNIMVGPFLTKVPPGPSRMPPGLQGRTSSVLSISILNLPQCGPFTTKTNGPLAVETARRVILEALDKPLKEGNEEGHYLLELHA